MKKTLSILGFAACSTAALAQFTTFSDRGTWAAAAGGAVLIEGFETAPLGALAAGVTHDLGLVTFRIDPIPPVTTSGASIAGSPAIAGSQDLAMNADDGMRTHTMQFDVGAITAFGFDYEGASTGGLAVLIINGERFNFASTFGGAGFFGVVANAGSFDTVFFGDESPGVTPSEVFNSDEYSFVAVPEPGTFVAIGAGIALLALRRRK